MTRGDEGNEGAKLAICCSALAAIAICALLALSVSGVFGESDEFHVRKMVEKQIEAQNIPVEDILPNLKKDNELNPDICAWLYFPGTNVSLPIAQNPEDDRKYLDTASDGTASTLGTVFMERINSPYFIDPVTILYGHAFEDYPDVMLGQLHSFEDEDFFKANDTFYVYLEDRVLTYTIACACPYVGDHIPSTIKLGGKGALQHYMEYSVKPGIDRSFERNVGEVDSSTDRILQISTCTFPSSATYRYVVTGLLEKEEMIPQ